MVGADTSRLSQCSKHENSAPPAVPPRLLCQPVLNYRDSCFHGFPVILGGILDLLEAMLANLAVILGHLRATVGPALARNPKLDQKQN